MSWFLLIFFALPLGTIGFWWWAHRRFAGLRRRGLWRTLLAVFCGGQLLLFASIIASRRLGLHHSLPGPLIAITYIWHLFILPTSVGLLMAGGIIRLAARLLARRVHLDAPAELVVYRDAPYAGSAPSRREFLGVAAAALPPLLTVGSAGYSLWQIHRFRVRPITVRIPGLPPALDGLRIAHLSDTHVGRFTRGSDLDQIVERTNALNPDLILFSGDLIDYTLADLPAAIAMARQWRSRHGLFICEGNHDLFEDRTEFEDRVKSAGIPLLLNEARTVRINGQAVQILGIKWGGQRRHESLLDQHVSRTLELLDPDAFPILLAHHPHAFDQAAAAGIPLTLSGHTHGGQLMLTPSIGPGPLMFKYWSGLYRQANSALVVSNGVGNWFPLRINAPAEIVDITLRTTSTARARS